MLLFFLPVSAPGTGLAAVRKLPHCLFHTPTSPGAPA